MIKTILRTATTEQPTDNAKAKCACFKGNPCCICQAPISVRIFDLFADPTGDPFQAFFSLKPFRKTRGALRLITGKLSTDRLFHNSSVPTVNYSLITSHKLLVLAI